MRSLNPKLPKLLKACFSSINDPRGTPLQLLTPPCRLAQQTSAPVSEEAPDFLLTPKQGTRPKLWKDILYNKAERSDGFTVLMLVSGSMVALCSASASEQLYPKHNPNLKPGNLKFLSRNSSPQSTTARGPAPR